MTTTPSAKDPNNELLPPAEMLRRLAISESGFVFDPVSGHSFTTNDTGLAILRLLQKEQSIDPVLTTLEQDFEVAPRDLERDVLEFIGMLREQLGAA
jgi:hypothetical protein